ncbi:MAG TPA: hypothetical protein VKT32_11275, partial [Chthonomonadaceae bacterium]|nr:hypothetical protein [Chthonomonadaceae bacterium]
NLNPGWLDGSFPRYYLDTLHALSDEPVMVGEFYMTSTENRSGNKNDSSGFPVVPTQKERAAGFTRTLTDLLKLPYVVGADWFQYYDEPTFGRGDGENYDMGLVDIADRPYEELTSASAALDREALHAAAGAGQPDARGGVPPAPQDAMAGFKLMEALGDWDRARGFVPPSGRFPMGDLYLCWDTNAVYAGLYATDIIEEGVYKDKHIPEADRAVWTLRLPGSPAPITIRLGAGRPPVVQGVDVRIADLSGVMHDVRNIVAVRLPAALFGRQSFHAGDTISLDTTFVSWARTYHIAWSGKYSLVE